MSIVQRKSAAVRREEIVEAALALIAGHGPGALTTGAIARRIGVSQAALFRHYPTKNAILVACVEWIGDQVRPAVLAAASAPGSAEQRLRGSIAAVFAVARRIPAMPNTMFSRELHAAYPGLREMIGERRRRFASVLEGLLREGVRDGEFAGGLDVAAAAWMIMGLVHCLLFRWHDIDPHLDLDREAATMLGLLLDGLKRRA